MLFKDTSAQTVPRCIRFPSSTPIVGEGGVSNLYHNLGPTLFALTYKGDLKMGTDCLYNQFHFQNESHIHPLSRTIQIELQMLRKRGVSAASVYFVPLIRSATRFSATSLSIT